MINVHHAQEALASCGRYIDRRHWDLIIPTHAPQIDLRKIVLPVEKLVPSGVPMQGEYQCRVLQPAPEHLPIKDLPKKDIL